MDQNNQSYEEVEIDLSHYIKTIFKRKITFLVIFLLTFVIGFANILFSPKIYRSSMMIQPPAAGPSLTGANDLDTAENLRGLIVNNVFDEELSKRLNLKPREFSGAFAVSISDKTNILQVSVDLESKRKEFGVVLLKNLNDSIVDIYVKRIEAERADIDSQIKFNERLILQAKKRAENLQGQIKEVTYRADNIEEQIKLVNNNGAQILEKELPKGNTITDSASFLLLANYIQNNYTYLNQLNNQFSELTMRRLKLDMELNEITSQLSDFQMAIDKLKIRSNFISNLKTVAEPRVSEKPINSIGKKTVVILTAMGIFFGLLVVFLQQFWANNLVKK